MSEPIDEKLYGYLGLAPLKTEGEALPYDRGAGPGVPLTRWGRIKHRVGKVRERIRYIPTRLWWAVFGDEYY
jgi:hypothetical protein